MTYHTLSPSRKTVPRRITRNPSRGLRPRHHPRAHGALPGGRRRLCPEVLPGCRAISRDAMWGPFQEPRRLCPPASAAVGSVGSRGTAPHTPSTQQLHFKACPETCEVPMRVLSQAPVSNRDSQGPPTRPPTAMAAWGARAHSCKSRC